IRCVRHPLGELCVEGRRESDGVDSAEHRELPPAVETCGAYDRLALRAVDDGSRLLQVDAVAVSPAVQAGAGVQETRGRELVPARQDRACQRAGDQRRMRALWNQSRATVARAMVFPDYRLRRTSAGEP